MSASAIDLREIEQSLLQRIRLRTWDRVRGLRIQFSGNELIIHGQTNSYFLKQLALEAVHDVLGRRLSLPVKLAIQVG